MHSALNNEFNASAIALSYESLLEPTEALAGRAHPHRADDRGPIQAHFGSVGGEEGSNRAAKCVGRRPEGGGTPFPRRGTTATIDGARRLPAGLLRAVARIVPVCWPARGGRHDRDATPRRRPRRSHRTSGRARRSARRPDLPAPHRDRRHSPRSCNPAQWWPATKRLHLGGRATPTWRPDRVLPDLRNRCCQVVLGCSCFRAQQAITRSGVQAAEVSSVT